MDARNVLHEAASRPAAEAKALIDTLPEGILNAHAGGHTNSIAWLLWHAGRQMDAQLAQLNGEPQVWHSQGFDAASTWASWATRWATGIPLSRRVPSWWRMPRCWSNIWVQPLRR